MVDGTQGTYLYRPTFAAAGEDEFKAFDYGLASADAALVCAMSGTQVPTNIYTTTLTATGITAVSVCATNINATTVTASTIKASTNIEAVKLSATGLTAAELCAANVKLVGTVSCVGLSATEITAANISAGSINPINVNATTVTGTTLKTTTLTATNATASSGEFDSVTIGTSQQFRIVNSSNQDSLLHIRSTGNGNSMLALTTPGEGFAGVYLADSNTSVEQWEMACWRNAFYGRYFTISDRVQGFDRLIINDGTGTFGGSAAMFFASDAVIDSWLKAQFNIIGTTDANQILAIGYDTTDNRGIIQAGKSGDGYKPLWLNPWGSYAYIGAVSTDAISLYVKNGLVMTGTAGISAANISLSGENLLSQYISGVESGRFIEACDGTVASPQTSNTPLVSMQKYDATDVDGVLTSYQFATLKSAGGSGSIYNLVGYAQNSVNSVEYKALCGVVGAARIVAGGNGYAYGIYAEGILDSALGVAAGAEIDVFNGSGQVAPTDTDAGWTVGLAIVGQPVDGGDWGNTYGLQFSAYASGSFWTGIMFEDGSVSGDAATGAAIDMSELSTVSTAIALSSSSLIKWKGANGATKIGRMAIDHYLNAEEPVYIFGAASIGAHNYLAFGGGSGSYNAATQIDFYTGATSATTAGTPRITIVSGGNVGIGTQTPGYVLDVVGTIHTSTWFESSTFVAYAAAPEYRLIESGATENEGIWKLIADSNVLNLQAISDDYLGQDNFLTFTRSGSSVASIQVPSALIGIGVAPTLATIQITTGEASASLYISDTTTTTQDTITLVATAKTTGPFLNMYHADSAFTGNSIYMNYGNGTGSFAGNYMVCVSGSSTFMFIVDYAGNTTINGLLREMNSYTPASSGAAGSQGSISWDASYIYVCTATNTWKRAAIAGW